MSDVTFLLTTFNHFREHYLRARRESAQVAENTAELGADDPTTRYYLSTDNQSGFATRPVADGVRWDRELVYVFSLERGRGDAIVRAAIDHGGATYLDCFEGHLTDLYRRHGWAEYSREPNWTPGGPDVVYMRWTYALGCGHVWTNVGCPAYRTYNPADCTCAA